MSGNQGNAPLAVGRVLIPVSYIASVGVHTAQSVAHFFLVSENKSRIPKGKKPQTRVAVLADRATYQADLDAAMNRCAMFSQIDELSLLEEHLAPLAGPFTELDFVLQQSPTQDFLRIVSAIFKPQQSVNTIPTYVLEQGNAVSNRAHCRLAMNALQDVVGTAAQESSLKTLRATKDREIQAMQEALQKQKDESLLELVELHTQKESLKHALSQAEQVLASTRRAAKEERDLMLAKIRQLEAERDVRMGKPPGSTPGFDESKLAIPQQGTPSRQQQQYAVGGNQWGSPSRQGNNSILEAAVQPEYLQAASGGYRSSPPQAPGQRPAGREQYTSNTGYSNAGSGNYATQSGPSYGAQGNNSWVQPTFNPGTPTSGHRGQQHQQQSYSASPYQGRGNSSSVALDQLQSQLGESERFLLSLQQKKSASGAGY